ncbi:MAG TPA: hypothetical protein VH762_01555 [Gemmatimonadaceae bacterium]|jgi:hypothetical protein
MNARLTHIAARSIELALSALLLTGSAPTETSGQRLSSRFYIIPAGPAALGQPVTLGVRPPAAGTTYRYVAAMKVTGAWRDAVTVGCTAPQTIGTGDRVSWTPASGSYRVTVYSSLTGLKGRDSTSVSYTVDPPSGGWLNIVISQLPNPSPPGNLTFQLTTNDRGPGHGYQWRARLKNVTTSHVTDWSAGSAGPSISAPLIMTPGTYDVIARVGAHKGNPCQIIEVSNDTLSGQVVR